MSDYEQSAIGAWSEKCKRATGGYNLTENTMSRPQPSHEPVDLKLEGILIPVSDVERSKQFYAGLGWRLDADFKLSADYHGVQLTPPHSPASILFGKGVTTNPPGSAQGLLLVVDDIERARADLIARGVAVSEVFHFVDGPSAAGERSQVAGPDPEHRSYRTWAAFNDPDGNRWLLQEVTTRLPGRLWPEQNGEGRLANIAMLTDSLREAEEHHGAYEASAPKHHWSAWYAAFIAARQQGKTAEEAAKEAAEYMQRPSA
jgi:catechol 2,3-dioxygenase-like lactoylglutathione lyase family enzyme